MHERTDQGGSPAVSIFRLREVWYLYRETGLALLKARRLIPFLLVSGPLVYTQSRFSSHLSSVGVGVVMCLSFYGFAPFFWRLLAPRGIRDGGLKLLVYGAVGYGTVWLVGDMPVLVWGLPVTFMTGKTTLWVIVGMFWVGGWGLGRDITSELGLRSARDRADQAERALKQAQILAVQSHFDPHFLFNTLNAIAEWCREDPLVAEKALLQLSDILRSVLEGVTVGTWGLAQELELCASVAELYRIRDPLRIHTGLETHLHGGDNKVPALILLPVIENAMKHGPGSGHDGTVSVHGTSDRETWTVTVSNPGAFQGPREGGLGLKLVKERLAAAYGSGAQFSIHDHGGRTVATLSAPVVGS